MIDVELDHWADLSQELGLVATLRRGDLSGTLTVVPGNSTTETSGDGVVYTSRQADFLALKTDIVINGSATELRHHDRLEIFGEQFEILPTAGERHYDPAGNYGVMIRIHTDWLGPASTTGPTMVNDVNLLFIRDANGQFAITNQATLSD